MSATLSARRQQEGTHAARLPDAPCADGRRHQLHCVVDSQAGGHASTCWLLPQNKANIPQYYRNITIKYHA